MATIARSDPAGAKNPSRGRRPARPQQRLLTLQQAAELYGPPETSFRDLVTRGELPVVKLGRRWWLRVADIESLLARSTEVLS